jgi:hypothetical protein
VKRAADFGRVKKPASAVAARRLTRPKSRCPSAQTRDGGAARFGEAIAGFADEVSRVREGGGGWPACVAHLLEDAVAVRPSPCRPWSARIEGHGGGVEQAMISESTGLMPWRASISTKARRSVARPAR